MKKNQTHILWIATILMFAFPVLGQGSAPFTSAIGDDIKHAVSSGTASAFQSGEGIERSFDGNKSTLYHSPWGTTTFPVTLTYFFNTPIDLDYVLYHTRTDGSSNGNFRLVEVQVRIAGTTTYQKALEIDLKGVAGAHRIEFENTQVNVNAVRLIVKSGAGDGNGFASCSEMEFYTKNIADFNPTTIFTDASCTSILPGKSRAELEAIPNTYYRQLALDLFDGIYPSEFSIDTFKAWPHPNDFSRNNRVGTYSLCDNPTGIYMRKGDTLMVFLDDKYNHPITLTLKNYNRPEGNGYWENTYYSIYKGANKVIADRDGLIYVFYHTTEDHLTASRAKIHFAYGKVNGYYDSERHTAADWQRILNATTYEYFDALGPYAHLSFPTASFKKNAATTGPDLVESYNDMTFSQREFMGFYKYPNRNPYNRSHFVVMYHSYMYSTSYHTGYNIGTMDALTNNSNFRKSPWGPAHEIGHANQHTPLLKWRGTTEVTTNIKSLHTQTRWGNTSRLIEENRYQQAFNDLLIPQKSHAEPDVFVKLVPFWQLELFFNRVLGRKEFYASLYEGARTRTTGNNPGEHQLNFVRMLTDSAEVNLTEFLTVWGFLKPISILVDDYGAEQLTITQYQASIVRNYIQSKNFPVLPYKIQYITDNNWQIYKNKSEVTAGTAIRFGNNYKMSGWSNVVAYEGWQGENLVSISQTNEIGVIGEINNDTKVFAIQYDGTRIEVIPQLVFDIETPKLSDDTNEYWYTIKNMGNETTNSSNSRSFTSMTATTAGSLVQSTTVPILRTQRWKLVDVSGKTGIVNENGLYIGGNLQATTIPFGWTLESVTQGGSSGYRLASFSGSTLQTVAHLSNTLTLMNYTPADAASVWQFIPANNLKVSDENNQYTYTIKSLRFDESVMGSSMTYDNELNKVSMSQAGGNNWKIVNYIASTGACNIINEEGKYLSILGSTPVLSETARTFYIYMAANSGIAGYRIATSNASGASMINFTSTGTLNISTTFSIGGIFSFSPTFTSGLQALSNHQDLFVENGSVVCKGCSFIKIYDITGRPVNNANLKRGIYIAQTDLQTVKISVP